MSYCLATSWWSLFSGPEMSVKEVLAPYWPALIVAELLAVLTTPVASVLAFKLEIVDLPDKTVKTHGKPTAYLGGVAVLVAFVISCLFGARLIMEHNGDTDAVRIIYAVCAGATLATIIGLVDDIKEIAPWQKLLGQAACSLFLIWAGVKPSLAPIGERVGLSLPADVWSALEYLVVVFFVLGASNSLNLLDGLDGLCGGVTLIITLGMLLLAIHLTTWRVDSGPGPARIIIALALVGSVFGFLVFNRHPAMIFLGDAGSILLGFLIATLMMLFAMKGLRWWIASILIFGLPILDTATALIRRFINRRPLFISDRGHIYDQMIDRGLTLNHTVAINYLLAAIYAGLGLICAIVLRVRYAVPTYIVIALASFVIVWRKGFFKMEGLRGATKAARTKT